MNRRQSARLARLRAMGHFLGWCFTYMSFIIPVQRLRETRTLLAFYHPRPSYPLHILIVPKRARQGLMEIQTADADFLLDLIQTVQSLVKELNLEPGGYRLITNGGAYQDVPHLHFHLVSDNSLLNTPST
jgi:histidine triad (HIT) family protein